MGKNVNSPASPSRRLAIDIIHQVLEKGSYMQVELDRQLNASAVAADDRRLAAEISQGTIRMMRRLDWYLNRHLKRPVERQNPWLRTILRASVYQLIFLDRIPAYACINDAVTLAREKVAPALGGLVNAVMRNVAADVQNLRQPDWTNAEEELSIWQSLPDWIVSLLTNRFGLEKSGQMAAYFNTSPPQYLRANRLLTSREALMQELAEAGIEAVPSPRHPDCIKLVRGFQNLQELAAWKQGHFYVQNEASMLPATILQPEPGESILDLCCGVGGKSSHLAEVSQNEGKIVAVDLHPWKIAVMQKTLQRLGITCVQSRAEDVLNYHPEAGSRAILLDAPCSGLGVLGRRPDLRWKLAPEGLPGLYALQLRLLERAAAMADPGGRILYVTCTLNPEENENIIKAFLERHVEFQLQGFADQVEYMQLMPDDAAAARNGMLTLLPGLYEADGMFYGYLKKNG